jgi:Isy1-like splicing family
LFVNEIPNAPTKSRVDIYKNITYDYYGIYGEDDYEMLEEEARYEKKLYEKTLDKWIDENKTYIQTKLKPGEEITQDRILSLIDDDGYDDFKKQHEISIISSFRLISF